LSILSLQAGEICGCGDGVSIDSDHTELSLPTFCREVGESNTAAPDFGHGARKQGGNLCPETGRSGDTPVLAEVGSDVEAREIAVLGSVDTRRIITTPFAVKGSVERP
jgi:hypothetical protein